MSFKHLHGAKPDAALHKPDAAYLRSLVKACGITQAKAAEAIGISERTMRNYLSQDPATFRPAPYSVQYTLEQLAANMEPVSSYTSPMTKELIHKLVRHHIDALQLADSRLALALGMAHIQGVLEFAVRDYRLTIEEELALGVEAESELNKRAEQLAQEKQAAQSGDK
jgi:transcriptional regulator with XRE-family HTH domain